MPCLQADAAICNLMQMWETVSSREGQGDVVPDSEDEQETPGQQDRFSAGDWDHAEFSAAAITVRCCLSRQHRR